MWNGPNIYRALEHDWAAQAPGRTARAALAGWQLDAAAFAGLHDPADVVRACQARGGDAAGARELLRAVLARAGSDPWAARTVLQAVLPGLAAVSRRTLGFVGPGGAVWASVDELDQHVVATAYERITVLAADPPEWPAVAVVDGTWQRVRNYALAECRRRRSNVSLEEVAEPSPPPVTTTDEELMTVLADAVARQVLEPLDAWVVYSSRVQGELIRALGPQVGHSPRSLWRRRQRAERQLVSDGGGDAA